jgi:hypothetical protein
LSVSDASLLRLVRLARARERWRHAARVVSARRDVFLAADPEMRTFAFASYAAAVDAEETAAAAMAKLVSRARRVSGQRTESWTSLERARTPYVSRCQPSRDW